MRAFALLPIAILLAGCWSPGPGQRHANRYPWDSTGAPAQPSLPPAPAPMVEAHGAIPRSPPPTPGTAASLPQPQPIAEPAPSSQWHQPPDGTYCVVALPPTTSGVTISGNPGGALSNDCTAKEPRQP